MTKPETGNEPTQEQREEAQRRRDHEAKELASMLSRFVNEKILLRKEHDRKVSDLVELVNRERRELEERHQHEWFQHRRKHQRALGRAALAALEKGRA